MATFMECCNQFNEFKGFLIANFNGVATHLFIDSDKTKSGDLSKNYRFEIPLVRSLNDQEDSLMPKIFNGVPVRTYISNEI